MTSFQHDDSTFRLVVDDWTGGLVVDVAADRIQDNECPRLIDALIHHPGPLRSRGALRYNDDGATGSICTAAVTASAIRLHGGQLLSGGGSYLPYIGITTSSTTLKSQQKAAAASVGGGPAAASAASGPAATVDDMLLITRTSATIIAVSNAAPDTNASGTTITMTNGSANITTVGAFFTSAMVGAFIDDGSFTPSLSPYRIKSVTDSTHAVLDRTYQGTTAGKTGATVKAAGDFNVSADATASVRATNAQAIAPAWGRLLFGNYTTTVAGVSHTHPNWLGWTGIIGSTEGVAPFQGTRGWSYDEPTQSGGFLILPSEYGAILAIQPFATVQFIFCERAIVVLRGIPAFDDAGSLDASTVYKGYSLSGPDCACSTPYGIAFYDQYRGLHLVTDNGRPPVSLSVDKVDSLLRTAAVSTSGAVWDTAIWDTDSWGGNFPPSAIGYASDHVFLLGNSRQFMYSFVRHAFVELDLPILASPIQGRGGSEELVALHVASGKIVDLGAILNTTTDDDDVSDTAGSHIPQLRHTSKSFGNPEELYRADNMLRSQSGTSTDTADYGTRIGYPGQEQVQIDSIANADGDEDTQISPITDLDRGHHVSVTYDGVPGEQESLSRQIVEGAFLGEGST